MGREVVMAYLVPPMEDEPPPEFITFVAGRLARLRGEAARLIGGDRSAPEITMEVLTDLAGRWRWLTWQARLTHRDAAAEYLDRRLTARTKQWREDQLYPVEVNVLPDATWAPPDQILATTGPPTATDAQFRRPPAPPAGASAPAHPPVPPEETLAQQLAFFLPSTVRRGSEVVAEAGIAWVHAYRRYLWRRYVRMAGGIVLVIGWLIQFMSQFTTPA
jgi:hypothetical protein